MTLTIELPDDLAEKLAPLTEIDRYRFAITALRERETETLDDLPPLPEPGFAAAYYEADRLAREAVGDFRTPGEVHIAERNAEWRRYEARIWAGVREKGDEAGAKRSDANRAAIGDIK